MGVIRGSSYYTVVDGSNWSLAQSNASAIGGDLVTINDSSEDSWLHSEYDIYKNTLTQSIQDSELDLYWIGLTDKDQEGNWRWISGEEVTYTNWHRDQPSGGTAENYSVLGWVSPQWCDVEHSYPDQRVVGGIAEVPLSYFSVSDSIIEEGEKGKVTISRTGGTQSTQTLTLTTSDGTAVVGDDYGRKNKTLTFAAGETSKTVNIVSKEDDLVEGNETFTLTLSASGADAVPAQISDGVATVTITDDDVVLPSYYSVADTQTYEGEGLYVQISRTGNVSLAHDLSLSWTNGTAFQGFDLPPQPPPSASWRVKAQS